MKKILTILSIFFIVSTYTNAQVAIGKQLVTNSSVSLEFADTENRGLILPYVENKSAITEEGTLIYDISDHKVKYKNGATSWANFSEDDGTADTIGVADISIQTTKAEKTDAKTVIGNDGTTNSTAGILVLSDTDKAMILPKVNNPHLNIINPAPGLMVYDASAKQLVVYNGKVWSFWKP